MKRGKGGSRKQAVPFHLNGSDSGPDSPAPERSLLVDSKDKYRSLRQRFWTGAALVIFFLSVIYVGHVALALMILAIQTWMVRELFGLARRGQEQKDRQLPGFREQQWYFFCTVVFFVHGRFVRNNLLVEASLFKSAFLARLTGWLLARHTFLSFALYCIGFVMFVLSLEKGSYVYQFGQYAWTHMICFIVVAPSSFFVSNVFESGILWFVLPAALIIINDIMAYFFGFFFGRTPLIKLSPKKTWEGFMGALISTVAISFFLARVLTPFAWMRCPRTDLSVFGWISCNVSDTYRDQEYRLADMSDILPQTVLELLRPLGELKPVEDLWARMQAQRLVCQPMQLHAMVLGLFASLVGPFGGFFASGFKRAFGVKDFGDAFPGHGGVTDRMDCQCLMAIFSYLYYHSFVVDAQMTVSELFDMALKLAPEEQVALVTGIGKALKGRGLLPGPLEAAFKTMGA